MSSVVLYTALGPDGHSPVYRYVGMPVAVVATVVLIHTGYSNQDDPVLAQGGDAPPPQGLASHREKQHRPAE